MRPLRRNTKAYNIHGGDFGRYRRYHSDIKKLKGFTNFAKSTSKWGRF